MEIQTLLILILALLVVVAALLLVLLSRRPDAGAAQLRTALEEALREEQRAGRSELREQLDSFSTAQAQRIDGFAARLTEFSARTDQRLDALRNALVEDARKTRTEQGEAQQRFSETLGARLAEVAQRNDQRIGELTQRNEQRMVELRNTLDSQLKALQEDNAQKLEKMRETVDEKLQSTLNTRLDSSFKLVSERLEQVQRGLGEMQQLATGVGDLKRVLTNVKNRGGWGEVQLENILEQVLVAEQYAREVRVRPDSAEAVDFAIRLPGRRDDDAQVWLP